MTSFAIKLIAVISMTIDHTAAVIGQTGLMRIFPQLTLHSSFLLIKWMRWLGRIAFPLFAFQIAEGARHTRSMPKYIGRLAVFALISEPIFYYAFSRESPTIGGFFEGLSGLNLGNVFFTMALGAAAIYVLRLLEGRAAKHLWLKWIPVCLLAAFIGEYIGCDYGMSGVLLIAALYLAKTKPQKCAVILTWSAYLYIWEYLLYSGWSVESLEILFLNTAGFFFAATSCLLIWRYNGKRGKNMKWSFYAYYPAHLLLLAVLRAVVRGN